MIVTGIKDSDITGFKLIDNIENNQQVIGAFVKNSAELKIINLNHAYDNLYHTYIDIQGFGSWYVNDLKTDEDSIESTLSLFDNTQKFEEPYQDNFSFPNTMGAWATWIGEQVGVPLKGDFLNSEIELSEKPYIGDNPTWKSAVQIIAKYASSYVQLNYDNTYSIKWFDSKLYEIEDWENFVHGNSKPPVNIIILSSGDTNDNVKWPEETPPNPYELRIEDDWNYIDRYSINESIYNQVNGFSYTPISKLNIPYGLLELRAGQKIKSQDIDHIDIETYITKHTLEWQGGDFNDPNSWTSSIEMAELNETVSNYGNANSTLNKLLKVERSTNKNTGLINDLIEQTTETDKRVTKAEQDIEGFRQTVSGMYDFTKEVKTNNKLTLEKAQAGNLIELHITGDMELLWPEDDLEPDDDLEPLDSYLIIENSKGEKSYIHLPNDNDYLELYTYEDAKDEYVLETVYDEKTGQNQHQSKVIRRVAIDENGTKSKLTKEVIENYGTLDIPLSKGTNKIYLESFTNTNLNYSAKYAIQNEVTDEFATKPELSTAIEQTESKIEEVAKLKVGNTEFNSYRTQTAKEISQRVEAGKIISSINQSAEFVKIDADKIAINGGTVLDLIAGYTINLETENISIKSNNFNVDKNNFNWTASNSSMTNDGTLTIKKGSVGNWSITNDAIYRGSSTFGSATSGNMYFGVNGLSIADKFKVTPAGILTVTDGNFTGKITANSGTIGGWSIQTGLLEYDTSSFRVRLEPGTNSNSDVLTVWKKSNDSWPIIIKSTGYASFNDIHVNGGTLVCWNITSTGLSSDRLNLNGINGAIEIYPDGGGKLLFNDGLRLGVNKGVMINSSSAGNKSAPSSGDLNIIACNRKSVYIATHSGDGDTSSEVNNICISSSSVTVNWQTIAGGSSRSMKKNITLLTEEEKDNIYTIIHDLPLYKYDYKKQYSGKECNYGFLIEDIEDTVLNDVLHIYKNPNDPNYKNYNSEDLTRVVLIIIQQLMKKIEKIESRLV